MFLLINSVLGDLIYLSFYNFRLTNMAVIVSVPKRCLCFVFCYESNYFPNLIALLCFSSSTGQPEHFQKIYFTTSLSFYRPGENLIKRNHDYETTGFALMRPSIGMIIDYLLWPSAICVSGVKV